MSSISSVSSTPVTKPVETPPPQAQTKPADNDGDDSSKTQTAKAALPPGQGVKVDMIA